MNILDQLAEHARQRVEAAKQTLPLAEIKRQALSLPKGDFRFEKALAKPGLAFICECKKASPSKGLIAPEFPYLQIAREYEAAGADAISVLTEPKWFLGSDDYLKEIASAVSTPCLRKDFTVDAYMIYEANLLGASAVLLICAILNDAQLKEYLAMRLLGAEVIPVTSGTGTLKDAVSEAMREWTSRISDTHYCLGSVMGPHPFPTIVRDFQAVISKEIKEQMLEKEGRLPDAVIACVGGGSNAIGSFYNFINDKDVRLIGCEAAGRGIDTFETAATINTGRLGIFHGMKSYFCQDEYGQIAPVYSISAGLDYPGIGPEHAWLHDIGRAEYVAITDDEAVNAFEYLARTEGIIPAIESAHAVAHASRLAPTMDKEQIIVITISGRGDKDCAAIARYRGEDLHE